MYSGLTPSWALTFSMLQDVRGRVRRQMKHSVRINFFNVGRPPLVWVLLAIVYVEEKGNMTRNFFCGQRSVILLL